MNILEQRERSGLFTEHLVDQALTKFTLKPEDRRFLQELVYGVVRWQLTLDFLINQKSGGKPQNSIVRNLLRLALYQMFWLERVPGYAAVNETVEICKTRGLIGQAKFINAVLRRYGRENEATRTLLLRKKEQDISVGFSHPEWLCRRWEQRWGRTKTTALLDWNNSPPSVFARVNEIKTTPEELIRRWQSEGVDYAEVKLNWVKAGTIFRLNRYPALHSLSSFEDGWFYVQDPSTLLAAELLAPETGEAILDMCAAPGGKTTYIAQMVQNRAKILAEDLEPSRLKLVEENCTRLGVTCVTLEQNSFPRDAAFDRVLLDAPCSNTGVMRRRIDLRWRIKPEEVVRLAQTQRELLRQAGQRTRIGGYLVYSTCSLEREENQAVVRDFLDRNRGFQLVSEQELTPFEEKVDGAYAAKLKRER